MKILQLRLRNFKLFENEELDFKQLTLLTGVNSSGKSSVLSAISSIAQTESPRIFPFEFTPNGKNCLLGSYNDIVYRNNTRKQFSINLTIKQTEKKYTLDSSFRYSPHGDHIHPQKVSFRVDNEFIEVEWNKSNREYELRLESKRLLEMRDDKDLHAVFDAVTTILEKKVQEKAEGKKIKKFDLKEKFLEQTVIPKGTYKLGKVSPHELLAKVNKTPNGRFVISSLLSFIEELCQKISYVGPVRATPLRYYPPNISQSTLDPSGSNCIALLHDWQKHDQERYKLVGDLIKQLELATKFKPESTPDEILKMIIQSYGHREAVNIADVGFGISQTLPFLVADVALPDDATLLINQPEVHLHPTSQAKIANYLTSRLDKRQYIVETHSEYIINRLRVLAMQGKINPDEVAIIFFGKPKPRSFSPTKYVISLQSDGSLLGAPKEFFQTYYVDSYALAMGRETENE